ncbi:MAG: sugar phosphate isomerase/epimerase family protein [Kiritimatiellia bacterium]|nr:sugar phosphate isomerase/epimerase family protein [Kiritimatiellia bacterium]
MKLSVYSYIFFRQGWEKNGCFDLEGMCRVARELNITGADIVTTCGLKPAEIRQILSDSGIAPVCYTFPCPALNCPTADKRTTGVDQVKTGVDIALTIGAPIIMVVTPGEKNIPRDISRRQYIHGLQESAAFARQAGITMTIENISPLLVISSDILEAIREVPGLKLTYDNGNVMMGGEDPVVSFSRCAAHVVHAHFKDWTLTKPDKGMEGLDGRYYEPALIGEGIVPQRSCLAAMKQAGYKGYINISYEGNKYPPDEATRKAACYLQAIMDELKICPPAGQAGP